MWETETLLSDDQSIYYMIKFQATCTDQLEEVFILRKNINNL